MKVEKIDGMNYVLVEAREGLDDPNQGELGWSTWTRRSGWSRTSSA